MIAEQIPSCEAIGAVVAGLVALAAVVGAGGADLAGDVLEVACGAVVDAGTKGAAVQEQQ